MNFKVGNKVVCTCGNEYCPKFAVITERFNYGFFGPGFTIRFEGMENTEQWSDDQMHRFEHEAVYNSPLYKALS